MELTNSKVLKHIYHAYLSASLFENIYVPGP